MRNFYIFDINKQLIDLNNNPYYIFKTFNEIYCLSKDNNKYIKEMFDNIINPLNEYNLNQVVFNNFKKDTNYSKFMNLHMYYDYYTNEQTRMEINNLFIKINTTAIKPTFLSTLNNYNNLFVCDFENKDYFWLESIA